MTPGPREPTAEQIQEYLRILVDDLLVLFTTGIRMPTPSCPAGSFFSMHSYSSHIGY